jgi:hypothetical protein
VNEFAKKFSKFDKSKNHLLVHTQQTPFSCSYCLKLLSGGPSLKAHLHLHSREKHRIHRVAALVAQNPLC